MVFVAMPSGDSSKTPPSRDSFFATLSAYSHKRITADQAAFVIVHYMLGGKSFNAAIDDQLQEGLSRVSISEGPPVIEASFRCRAA